MRAVLWTLSLVLLSLATSCGADGRERALREAESDARLRELSRGAASFERDAGPPSAPGSMLRGLAVYGGGQVEAAAKVSRVRAVLELAGEVPIRRRERSGAAGTRAVVFELEGVRVASGVSPVTMVRAGGLERVLVDADGEGATVMLELGPAAQYRVYAMEDTTKRIVVDVEQPVAPTVDGQAELVLIDPGHGGEDLGSPGPFGLWEGKLTLDISRRVRSWLTRVAPGVRVRMTRDSDVYITLEERAAMANALGADLFVSVHLNAATTTVDKGGVATYVLDVSNDRNVLRLAARENGTRTTDVSPMQFLVGSLARTEQRQASERLANLIQRGTLFSARRQLPTLADRGVKSAMFYVLVGAQMPAVLVEGSFITQPDEAALLRTEPYRDAIAEGIARGIAKYLAEN